MGLAYEGLGDLDTLRDRLQDEIASSNTVVPWIGLVAAWARKPVMRTAVAAAEPNRPA